MNTNEETQKKPIHKKLFKGKKKKVILISLLVVAVVAAGYAGMTGVFSKKTVQTQQTAQVEKGKIQVVVSGSGPLASTGISDLPAKTSGTLVSLPFKEGATVKAGDLIAQLDDFDAQMAVKKAQNNLAQTQDALNSNLRDLNSCTVVAPFDGDVSELTIKTGDTIGKGGSVLTLTDRSTLKAVVSFKNNIRHSLKKGTQMTMTIYDSTIGETYVTQGVTDYVYPASYKAPDGQEVYNVRLLIHNTGTLKDGMVASADVSLNGVTSTSVNSGTLAFLQSTALKSQAGGTVSSINVTQGQTVKKGTLLVKLSNTDLELSVNTNRLKLEQLVNELATAQKQLEYTKIVSPIDGTLASLPFKVGASLKVADVVATVTDVKHMEFKVDVDELDIAKIKLGQSVSVTVDAIPESTDKPFKGVVSKIAVIGTSTNGVTTYPVTIIMNDGSQLKDGMNANGDILISGKSDILVVPLEAVQKNALGSFVMIKGVRSGPDGAAPPAGSNAPNSANFNGSNTAEQSTSSSSSTKKPTRKSRTGSGTMTAAQKAYYEGSYMKRIETGLSDDTNVEILSGLKLGDTVVLPPLTTTAATSTPKMGGFGGGGAPGGQGAPSSSGSGNSSGTKSNNSTRSNSGGN